MKELPNPASTPADAKRALLHDDIAQCARDLWVRSGKPVNHDQAIWLEAEQRLLSATQTPWRNIPGPATSSEPPPPKPGHPPELNAP